MIPNPKFQIFKGSDDQFYFRLTAQNGQIIFSGEGYASKQGAADGIGAIKRNLDNIEQAEAKNGQYFFRITSNNGEKLGRSEMYDTQDASANGAISVAKAAGPAPVEDTTLNAETFTNPKFEVFEGKSGEFYFRLNARNGQIILTSEGYASKQGAKGGTDSVKNVASDARNYDKREAKDGRFYFVLQSTNDEIVGMSQMYETESGRDNGIESVVTNAPDAPVEDTTLSALIEVS